MSLYSNGDDKPVHWNGAARLFCNVLGDLSPLSGEFGGREVHFVHTTTE